MRIFQLVLASFLFALCTGVPTASAQAPSAYLPGPAVSGSWYDAARDGEGIVLQYLPNGKSLLTWFSYPAVGETGAQAWLISDLGSVEGSKIKFPVMFQPQGGVFGDNFDATRIKNVIWGSVEIEFRNCNALTLRYVGPAAFGSGERNMVRLTAIDQLNCDGGRTLNATGGRALSGLRAKSGAWYVPSRSGEGWMIEELADGRSVVYWFTYDPQGRQAWTVGVGKRDGDRIEITDNFITSGTVFGPNFNPQAVRRTPWGSLTITFSNCNTINVSYNSTLAGYGAAARSGVLLTSLAGSVCIDGSPSARTNGAWVEAAAITGQKQSEHASAVLDNKIYVMGGIGDARGFKRYDPATNAWTILPNLPGGRDHLAGFAMDGGVYFSGGAVTAGGDEVTSAFRFDVASNKWEVRPEIASTFGSHATLLNGRAYIGSSDGSLQEYDPAQRAVRRIPRALPARSRDHSQVVAFLGEIWMIAGRFPETVSVTIYDPVSATWRAGPSITNSRGGFAAAVVGDQIVIAGGEVFLNRARVEPTIEVYAAGSDGWRLGPDLPVPVHGVTGATINGRFYVVGGSTTAGTEDGNTGRMFSILFAP